VYWLHSVIGVWGWVICLLTISVKILVFPLQLPSLKNGFVMRRLKPQIDEISEKYTDDLALKTAALQELYRREGIPQSKQMLGCLPMLLQMPVWISLYTGLATAVELYHVPFGPLIPDLSHADPYHVIPIVLGGSSFIQQKLMPSQGMDPAQQKMMLFMMPGILTAMMFFLPAGLGVYMLTNTWLGICQQLLVERTMRNKLKQPGQIEVREVKKDEDASPALALSSGTGDSSPAQKRKVRARG
jgi:YidC/Oxa1 family membrane protein insertase